MSIAELRKNRMAQGLSLTEISRRTRIGVTHLRHIEEGNFKSLPPGFYARAFVRAYAEAIGVDADIVLGELSEMLPATQAASSPAPDSSPAGSASLRTDAAELIPDARMQVLKQLLDRHNDSVAVLPSSPKIDGSAGVSRTRGGLRRFFAASIDGLLLASIYLGVLVLTAALCGVTMAELVRVAGIQVLTVLALITVLYVMLMGGIAGRTIGAMMLDVPLLERAGRPMDLGTIARRSVDCVKADVAAATDVGSLIEALIGRTRRAA
jgi:transcriptional regulator with XRE-family HTH domain